MNGTVATIVTLLGALCGIGGLYVSWRTSKASAKKDEVEALRGIIAELREYAECLEAKVDALEAEVMRWKKKYNALRQWVIARTGLDPEDQPTGQLTMIEPLQQGGGG